MTSSPAIILALACVPVLCAQSDNRSAERSIVLPATAAPANPPERSFVAKILGRHEAWEQQQPLTEKQRLRHYLLSTAGPVHLFAEATAASIRQWDNQPREWGQGWGAWGKRFGDNLAYNAVRQTIVYGSSMALHEDNRYFASTETGAWRRTRHALLSTFTARQSDGQSAFSISSVSGVLGASALSTIWRPAGQKGVWEVTKNAGFSFAATAGLNVVREFLPPLLHRAK